MTVSDHVECARELAGLRRELESVSADRVQLEALYASSRDEVLSLRTQVHGLNNQLTAVILERDALKAPMDENTPPFREVAVKQVIAKIEAWNDEPGRMCDHNYGLMNDARRELAWILQDYEQSKPWPPRSAKCAIDKTCLEFPRCPCGGI